MVIGLYVLCIGALGTLTVIWGRVLVEVGPRVRRSAEALIVDAGFLMSWVALTAGLVTEVLGAW